MAIRDLPMNSLFKGLALYFLSLASVVIAHRLVSTAGSALLSVDASTGGLLASAPHSTAQWVRHYGIGLGAILVALSLLCLMVIVTRARTREDNILGMAALSVGHCVYIVVLLGTVMVGAASR